MFCPSGPLFRPCSKNRVLGEWCRGTGEMGRCEVLSIGKVTLLEEFQDFLTETAAFGLRALYGRSSMAEHRIPNPTVGGSSPSARA